MPLDGGPRSLLQQVDFQNGEGAFVRPALGTSEKLDDGDVVSDEDINIITDGD
jgi:hypothetical protein